MYRQKHKGEGRIFAAAAVLFSLGVILGAVSLFYMPAEWLEDAKALVNVSSGESETIKESFRENYLMELIWIGAVWIMGSISVTSPMCAAVLSIRGFVMGFSVSFMSGHAEQLRFLVCYILPQCMVSLPVMTIFIYCCIKEAREKRYKDTGGASYFLKGILFAAISVLSALFESGAARFFVRFL